MDIDGAIIPSPTASRTSCAIAARITRDARPLERVLADAERYVGHGDDSRSLSGADELLHEWRTIVAQGDDTLFARRLAWDALTPASVRAALMAPRAPVGHTIDPWASRLVAIYGESPDETALRFAALDVEGDRACNSAEPLAFEALFIPLLVDARARLAERVPDLAELATDEALVTLERSLLSRLARIGMPALRATLSVQHTLETVGRMTAAEHPLEVYERFIERMCAGQLLEFFVDYPVAARLCITVTELWTDAAAELLARLRDDRPALASTFNEGARLGPVAALRTDLSDPHSGGRSVAILSWANGRSIVYKPRCLGVDAAFGHLLEWVKTHVHGLELRRLTVLERDGYGWIEFAAPEACASEGISRYYERCGALLCVAYALNGTDFHYENLLAAGEHPVLLDLEMLLGPNFPLVEELKTLDMVGDASHRCVLESVINVRMLPSILVRGTIASETGALGDPIAGHRHLPVVDGVAVAPFGYVDEIVAGFERTYRALQSNATALLAPGGVLAALASQPVRFILRNTSLYASLLERCLHPRFLRSGAMRSIQLDVLAKTFLRLDATPAVWPALAPEIRDLERMDVPLFIATASELSIRSGGIAIARCLKASAYDEMERRVRRLGDADLDCQRGLIRATFAASTARGLRASVLPSRNAQLVPGERDVVADELLAVGSSIADRIWRARVAGDCGASSWIGPRYYPVARRYAAAPMPNTLFDGYGGIALLFAALARATGRSEHADRARSALVPAMRQLPDMKRMLTLRRTFQPGIGCGIGAIAYVFASSGRCLADDEMLRAARHVAALMHAFGDRAHGTDFVSGVAGGILALLAVHDACGTGDELAAAVRYGHRLLDARVTDADTGLRVWPGDSGSIETGMAHGQTGICFALNRLASRSGAAEFGDAAVEAEAHERLVRGRAREQFRDDERRAAWAHGATGLAIARLDALMVRDEPDLHADLATALEMCEAAAHTGVDTLCCGDAGRIEVLSRAGSQLARPLFSRAARVLAGRLLDRRAECGEAFETGWSECTGPAWQLGLFHGEAGVGLSLVRLACDDPLPSPLFAAC